MSSAPENWGRPGLGLAGLLVCCLPLPASADEIQYLPDNPQMIASIDLGKAAKTKTFAELRKIMSGLAGPEMKEVNDAFDAMVSKIARFTVGINETEKNPEEGIVVATTIKPMTIDEVKAMKKPQKYQKNFAFKEIKHGSVTIYQETYQFQFRKEDKLGPVNEGEAFFLAEGTYIVSTRNIPLLKKIIDRAKAPMLTAAMSAGLKQADLSNTACMVVDLQGLTPKAKESLLRTFKGLSTDADIKANFGKTISVVLKANEVQGQGQGVGHVQLCRCDCRGHRQGDRRAHPGRYQDEIEDGTQGKS